MRAENSTPPPEPPLEVVGEVTCGRVPAVRFGIESTADKVGTVIGVGTAVGIAAHAVTTNIRKRRAIRRRIETAADHDKPSARS